MAECEDCQASWRETGVNVATQSRGRVMQRHWQGRSLCECYVVFVPVSAGILRQYVY